MFQFIPDEQFIRVPDGEDPKVLMDHGKYEGEYNGDGLRHGKGKCVYFDGSTYEGDWSNGWRHGKGTLSRLDGY